VENLIFLTEVDGRIVPDWSEGLEAARTALESAHPVVPGVMAVPDTQVPVILYRLRVLLGRI